MLTLTLTEAQRSEITLLLRYASALGRSQSRSSWICTTLTRDRYYTCLYARTHVRTYARTHWRYTYAAMSRENDAITQRARDRVMLISCVALARIQAGWESTRNEPTRTGKSASYAVPRISRASQYSRHCAYMHGLAQFLFPGENPRLAMTRIRGCPDGESRDNGLTIVLTCDVSPATQRRASVFFASGSKTNT